MNTSVDWLTITSRDKFGETTLYDTFNDLEPHFDQPSEPWRWNGYTGLKADGVACGTRDDGTILRASAEWSNEVVWALPKVSSMRPVQS